MVRPDIQQKAKNGIERSRSISIIRQTDAVDNLSIMYPSNFLRVKYCRFNTLVSCSLVGVFDSKGYRCDGDRNPMVDAPSIRLEAGEIEEVFALP